jgi:hypothetical protein
MYFININKYEIYLLNINNIMLINYFLNYQEINIYLIYSQYLCNGNQIQISIFQTNFIQVFLISLN